ncbi:hypothetical protein AGMMS50239_28690 [Bacteroidia bacterium]|nr:hypothetical protein AGMMS50239_28690 [Bacteroidia bacterium]
MEIKVLKTFELSNNDWVQIIDGFNSSFHRLISFERLKSFYEGNVLGYSYHALGFEDDKLIGFNSIIPYKYLFGEDEIIIGQSCSSFVLKEYRKDIFIFKDLYDALWTVCSKDSFITFVGVPNKNSYKYSIVFMKHIEIGTLPYFALPVRISKALNKPTLFILDLFSYLSAYGISLLSSISFIINSKEKKAVCRIDTNENFYNKRFPDALYTYYQSGNTKAWYRIVKEEGIRTAYIMEFIENGVRTSKALIKIVWHILLKEKPDMILFVGTLCLKQFSLIKLPKKYEPKNLPLMYNQASIMEKRKYESLSKLHTWNFSLMNFDVR